MIFSMPLTPLDQVILWFRDVSLLFMVFYVLSHSVLFIASAIMVLHYYYTGQHRQLLPLEGTDFPKISILVPAYNEGIVILDSLSELLQIDYPNFDIVVVNDGSSDDTLERLKEHFELHTVGYHLAAELSHKPIRGVYRSQKEPRICVIDKVNGRKADALNAALAVIDSPYFVCIDADSYVHPVTLRKAIVPFLTRPHVVAVGCGLRVMEGATRFADGTLVGSVPNRLIYALQTLEYIRVFVLARMGWDLINATPLISGAFAMYNTSVVILAGGYRPSAIGDDSDLTLNVHEYLTNQKQKYQMVYLPEPLCWTQIPGDWHSLFNQRIRWQRGSMNGIYHRFKFLMSGKHPGLTFGSIPFIAIFTHFSCILQFLGIFILLYSVLRGIFDIHVYFSGLLLMLCYWLFVTLLSLLVDEVTYKTYRSPFTALQFFFYSIIWPFVYSPFITAAKFIGFYREATRMQASHGAMKRHNMRQVTHLG
ncbi:MAG: glycosyltransferase family 2 protein [Vampirovibrionales bacterium]